MEFLKKSFLNCKRCLTIRAIHQHRAITVSAKVCGERAGSRGEGAEGAGGGAEGAWEDRVVSGLQPTGALHVGNYFAALRRVVRLQQAGDHVTLFIADLHSLTTRHDAAALRADVLDLAALALASGFDASRGALFVQSAVARHAELCWVLACVATRARLEAQAQFREKAARLRDVPLGLLLYPVLQAADVLLHRGARVPAGADQLQHLQLAAALARAFAHRYGPAFPVPRPLLPEDGSDRIRSLRDPSKKMSKSDPDGKSRVLLADDDAAIALKIRKAVTDFTPEVTWEPEARPGVANLVRLHCLAADLAPEAAVRGAAGLSTAQYKGVVAGALADALRPVRARYLRLRERPALLRAVLEAGAARAQAQADETYADVARRVGLAAPALPPPALLRSADELQRLLQTNG